MFKDVRNKTPKSSFFLDWAYLLQCYGIKLKQNYTGSGQPALEFHVIAARSAVAPISSKGFLIGLLLSIALHDLLLLQPLLLIAGNLEENAKCANCS